MKKALVFYLYGTKNAGDLAICIGAIELLRQKGYHITMVSRFSEAEEEYLKSQAVINDYFPDVEVYPGPFSFERDFSLVKKLKAYAHSYLKVLGLISDSYINDLIAESDVVFFNGGNLLRGDSLTDYLRLMALFYPIQKAKKARKRIYCLPQSTAGIDRIGQKLLRRYLHGLKQIYIREDISYKALKERFPELPLKLSTDLAFFCRDTQKARDRFPAQFPNLSDAPKAALILRHTGIGDIGTIDIHVEEALLKSLQSFVEKHPEYEYWIILQTLKDRDISLKFQSMMDDGISIRIIENHDPLLLRELYKQMVCTITMRLHAGILSLSAHTPVVGLFCADWGLKNPGIMSAYHMPYAIVENQAVDLEEMFLEAVSYDREAIKAQIDANIQCIDLESER